MNTFLCPDRRSTSLLNRVRDDVSSLRADIGSLVLDATKRTLPNSAHELADRAKSQLAAGGAYAASRLKDFRSNSSSKQSVGWIGGAVVLGLLAYGAYALCRDSAHCQKNAADDSEE